MQTHLVFFATRSHYPLLLRFLSTASLYGNFDKWHFYNTKRISGTDFYRNNVAILTQQHGAGFWLWKPYIILQTMQQVAEGDIITYCDVDYRFVAPSSMPVLFEIAKQKGMVFFKHKRTDVDTIGDCTKRDTLILLNADTPKFHHTHQLQAGFSLWRNDARSREFVTKWLAACTDARMLTDQPNQCGKDNLSGFRAHRHDQSIISILAEQHNIELFPSPLDANNPNYPKIVRVEYIDLAKKIRKSKLKRYRIVRYLLNL